MGQTFPFYKWHRYGLVWKLYRIDSPTKNKLILRIDLYILLVILLIGFFIYLGHLRYEACMEIFNSFWYCVAR